MPEDTSWSEDLNKVAEVLNRLSKERAKSLEVEDVEDDYILKALDDVKVHIQDEKRKLGM